MSRDEIICIIKEEINSNYIFGEDICVLDSNDIDHIAERAADRIIGAQTNENRG